jgi:hypothetical protein
MGKELVRQIASGSAVAALVALSVNIENSLATRLLDLFGLAAVVTSICLFVSSCFQEA